MTTFDVVLVTFPFTNLKSKKQRPCLILKVIQVAKLESLFVLAMITSNISGLEFPEDCQINEIKDAGLPKESLIRTSKIVTLEGGLIRKKLGRLSKADQSQFKKKFQKFFSELL